MAQKNLNEFLTFYNKDGSHPVTEIELNPNDGYNDSPFIVVHSGPYAVIINPQQLDDQLSIDVHPFVGGEPATAGVFGMPFGRRVRFPATGTTSAGFPSASLVVVLVGEQRKA